METALMQVRATIRHIITGGFVLTAFFLFVVSPQQNLFFYPSKLSGQLMVGGILVAYMIGIPVAKWSAQAATLVYALNLKRMKTSLLNEVRELLRTHASLGSAPSFGEFCTSLGLDDIETEADLWTKALFCKYRAWHSGSPLWAHLNEREQLISGFHETWLALAAFILGTGYQLYLRAELSIGWLFGLGTALVLVISQVFYRHRSRVAEIKDMFLVDYIIRNADIRPPS